MTYGGTGETVKLLHPLTRAVVCNVAMDAATKSQAQLKCTLPNSAAIAAVAERHALSNLPNLPNLHYCLWWEFYFFDFT